MVAKLKMRLGDLLVQELVITEDQLMQALKEQKESGRKLGQALIDLKFVTEVQLLGFLAKQLNVPFVNLTEIWESRHAHLAIYNVFDEESESEVNKCRV